MDYLMLLRDWGFTFTQTLMVRFPLERKWDSILEYFGHDEKLTVVTGTCLSLVISFYFVNFFLISLDLFGKPEVLMKYKIQKDKNVPVDRAKYLKCFIVACLNKVMTCAAVVLFYPIMKYRGMTCFHPLPSIPKFIFDYFVMIVANEFLFYYFHRMVHHPLLYKRVHKMHHEWIAPVGFAAIYNHPIDHVFSHILPLLVPPMLTGCHMLTLWVWCILYQLESNMHHSNFHFPFLSSPQFHDYHHLKFTENFGALGWLDSFHGTNTNYLKSIQAKRGILFFDFTPVSEKFPSENEKEN